MKYLSPIVEEIQALEAEGDDSDHEYELREERDRQIFESIPKLTCCEDARRYYAVRFSADPHKEFRTSQEDPSPKWVITEDEYLGRYRKTYASEGSKRAAPEVKFCPFCGVGVPKMVPSKAPPRDMFRCTDGGYYCDTCEERLMSCLCLPLEAGYEPEDS